VTPASLDASGVSRGAGDPPALVFSVLLMPFLSCVSVNPNF
jgi:hypothetical protein